MPCICSFKSKSCTIRTLSRLGFYLPRSFSVSRHNKSLQFEMDTNASHLASSPSSSAPHGPRSTSNPSKRHRPSHPTQHAASTATAPGGGGGGDAAAVVRVSKEMSRVLRHHPPPGNAMDAEGWVALPVLLRHLRGNPTEAQVRMAVSSNDKQRFVLDDSVGTPRIRATQGHSVQLESPILDPVTSPYVSNISPTEPPLPSAVVASPELDAAALPSPSSDGAAATTATPQLLFAVHVTGTQNWSAIKESGELRRMKRTHIHFATQPHMARANPWASVWLRLDLAKALEAGHLFYMSTNGVLLTEGPLPITFVEEIANPEENLPEEWRRGRGRGGGGGGGKGKERKKDGA